MWLLIYLIIKNIPIGIIIKIKRKNGKADYNISLLDQSKLLTGKNISNLRYADDTTYSRKWRGTKAPLVKVREEREKAGLTLKIQKTKIMACGPITLWQIDGEKNGNSDRFIFLWSKITMDGDKSHEIKRHLFLGRKSYEILDSVLKSRDITRLTKVCIIKAMFFSSSHVWMWELDHKED